MISVLMCTFWIVIFASVTHSSDPPNILFILLDDMGFGDLGCRGGQFPTPHMDQLYENSLRLNRHYVHLLCSPSRTQFLTGRYAMNLGFGDFFPWNDKEIGGIPIGQPTIANWLSEYGEFSSYALGKWHLGYANENLTPLQNGFDHFYGFYQGAIDYITKVYEDIEDGNSGIYDFWEDGVPNYDVISNDENTMQLYRDKITEYLQIEADRTENKPFYMYLALQSMHTPYPDIQDHKEECEQYVEDGILILPDELDVDQYKDTRSKYCTLLLLTDDIIGDIISTLHSLNIYENSLIVFTTDNGGDVIEGASNFPLRGTKGETFEGNERVISVLSGGYIESLGLIGQERNHLFSNLDWTPTLLEFAGYLNEINTQDITWDGISQYDMIVNNVKQRDNIILNIGDANAKSAAIIAEYDNKLYKYITSEDGISVTDRWNHLTYNGGDAWSIRKQIDDGNISHIQIGLEFNGANISHIVDGKYLFDLTNDESEIFNLIYTQIPHYSSELNQKVMQHCNDILHKFLQQSQLFSPPINLLHSRFDETDLWRIGGGKFVQPFLTDSDYKEQIQIIFKYEKDVKGIYHSSQQIELYLNEWVSPSKQSSQVVTPLFVIADYALINNNTIWILLIHGLLIFVVYYFCKKNKYSEYQIIKDDL